MEKLNFESEKFKNFDWSKLKKVIFDFDSTFYDGETLDEFLNWVLIARGVSEADRKKFKADISAIQAKGMTDEGSIEESLRDRLVLIGVTQAELEDYMADWLEKELSEHNQQMVALAQFLHLEGVEIHILSGGFKYMIDAYLEKFAPFIDLENVYANDFVEKEDKTLTANFENLMAFADGKSRQMLKIIEGLQPGETFVTAGDSPRDMPSQIPTGLEAEMNALYEKVLKVAFTEYKKDKTAVVSAADIEAKTAKDFVKIFEQNLVKKAEPEFVET